MKAEKDATAYRELESALASARKDMLQLIVERRQVIEMMNAAARECGFDGYDESTKLWRNFASHFDRFKQVADSRLAKLETELAAARQDSARLDWLAEHPFEIPWKYRRDGSPWFICRQETTYTEFRAAIDAARKEKS